MHIDWPTLALQTVNVLILVWILSRFLFGPVQAIVAKRREQAAALLADAATAKRQAEESTGAAQRARNDIEAQRELLIAEAHSEAAKEKARLLELAQKEAARLQAEAARATVQERSAMQEQLIARVKELAVEIAQRLMTRISPQTGLDEFVDGLCAALEKLPPEARAAFATEGGRNESIGVVTAAVLSQESEGRLRKRLAALLGQGVEFNFNVDPSIIAGIELHGQTSSLRNSLRQDLDRIAADLDFEV